jgi:hypothetical protein
MRIARCALISRQRRSSAQMFISWMATLILRVWLEFYSPPLRTSRTSDCSIDFTIPSSAYLSVIQSIWYGVRYSDPYILTLDCVQSFAHSEQESEQGHPPSYHRTELHIILGRSTMQNISFVKGRPSQLAK